MQPSLFYIAYAKSSTKKQGIPFILLTKKQVEAALISSAYTPLEKNAMKVQQFKGNIGDICFIYDAQGYIARIYIGSGEDAPAAAIAATITRLPAGTYYAEHPLPDTALLSWSLAQYQFTAYKTIETAPRILYVLDKTLSAILAEADAVFLVRDLINTPTNAMLPETLASIVAKLAKTHGATFKQWIGDKLLHDNFPAIHTVGRASASAPRLLSLTWGNPKHPRVALVGKGVCFDSGGLDIKPAENMRLMKKDMGGAAHVIALAQWIMVRELPIRLHVLVPAVENAISSNAYRPGDVLTMRNKLRVEIDNTDAEGRLILADALVKACEHKPELLIDFATLTGAARVAVGTDIAAMFTNDDQLAEEITATSQQVHDPVWRLPLFAGYLPMLKSSIADLVNASPLSYAGAITAALFMQHFVETTIPWVHFDIMAWNLCSTPGRPAGGEALGLRTMAHYLFKRYGIG